MMTDARSLSRRTGFWKQNDHSYSQAKKKAVQLFQRR
jgi:hypothetical protein